MLGWSDPVRNQIARWLTPEPAPKPNGLDLAAEPGQDTASERRAEKSNGATRPMPPPRQAKPPQNTPFNRKTAEIRLIEALTEHPAASISALAKATGANRTTIRERLGELASRGEIEKGGDGLWRLKTDTRALPDPTSPPSAAS